VNIRKEVHSLYTGLAPHSLNTEYWDEPERGNLLIEYRPGIALTEYRILG
jgi:hypothetical protein